MAKHPVPKKKTSKARGSRRYKSFQNRARKQLANGVQLSKCEGCGAMTPIHQVCPECGVYRGQQATAQKEAEPEVTTVKAD